MNCFNKHYLLNTFIFRKTSTEFMQLFDNIKMLFITSSKHCMYKAVKRVSLHNNAMLDASHCYCLLLYYSHYRKGTKCLGPCV